MKERLARIFIFTLIGFVLGEWVGMVIAIVWKVVGG